MIPELQQIYNILSSFLGEAKNGFDGRNMQLQFPCPHCIETKGEQERYKYNLEVNLSKGVFQCWSCLSDDEQMKGSIYRLIRHYGNGRLLKDYTEALVSLHNSDIYKIKFTDNDFKLITEDEIKQVIDFPKECIPLTKDKNIPKDVTDYLKGRNIGWDIINKYHLGYTRFCKTNNQQQWSFRIILPSYDAYGNLNYCVGRDYTGKAKNKYFNTKANKTEIIFNEEKIQWDADITLVEGPFDHIVVPNSIPLLGKHLEKKYKLYQTIYEKANANINIWCDGDAYDDMIKIYNLLDSGRLKDRVRYIPTRQLNDPSLLYQLGGKESIIQHLKHAQKLKK